jgi:hypothetical protein
VAAAVLVAMVLASALHAQPDDPGPDTTPPPAAPTPAGIGDPPVPSGRQSPLSGDVVVSGDDVTWHRLCGIDLPFSARYGPHRRDGDRASGFANEPTGAVLAALHLSVRVSPQLGPDVFVPTLAEQVTGPDATVLAHEVHAQYQQLQQQAQARYGQPVCPIYGRLAGFLLDSHTSVAASLRLLIEAPGPGGGPRLVSVLVQLSWVDGDWRLVAPPRGDWARVRTLLPASAAGDYQPLAAGR